MSDMATQKDVQRSFRLPASLDAKLIAKAEKLDRSVSWIILRCLEAELLGHKAAMGEAFMRGTSKR
jgi:predicted transcriptional regulator